MIRYLKNQSIPNIGMLTDMLSRQQTDLSTKLQASQNLLKEAKQFVPGPTAQKIAEYLVSDPF
jgi:hypothetical protein